MSNLILYQFDECPYCQRVQRVISQLNLGHKIEFRNTRMEARNREELRRLTGRTQVPCLVIDGKAMFESEDIVSYLSREYGQIMARP